MQPGDDILVIETAEAPSSCIIWLHGLGADKHDFESIIPGLRLHESPGVRFVFPNAPIRPITVNGGMNMRGWYDIRSMRISEQEDEEGIRESASFLSALIEQQVGAGIPAHRIILAGFSQGGAIALFQGVRQQQRLAGIIALSSYLPLHNTFDQEASAEIKNVPVFIGHGTDDDIVPVELGVFTRDLLSDKGVSVDFAIYPMMHSVSAEEIADLGRWINNVLAE
jgi:phospholipase/carboxylesterase